MNTALISNPPYNMKWNYPVFAQMQSRFCNCELPPESNANYAFILSALDVSDRAVFLLPCGVLSSSLNAEFEIRKYLIEKNYIESIILCPDKMFESTSIATCIITLSKSKTTTNIMMIDARQTFTVEQREQNGQFGGNSHEKRTYVKDVKTFSEEDMLKILNTIEEKKDIPEFSKNVSIQTIAENKYSLLASKYIDLIEEENVHRDYKDIIADLNRTVKQKNVCKLTINETIAKSLELYDFGMLQKSARENSQMMNETIGKMFGVKIEQDNYISLTKNKNEIKFENNSKEELSTIFRTIMQMYRQHIIYLNEEENRYLAELRDAILPDLLSGKLEV